MSRWTKRFLGLAVAALVLVGGLFALRPQPEWVDAAAVSRGVLRVTVNEDGTTRIRERYVVSTPLAGRVLRIGLEPGDVVQADATVLARMQPTDPDLLDSRALAQAQARVRAAEQRLKIAKVELAKAEAALHLAETELGRQRRLRDQNATTAADFEQVELAFAMRTEETRAAGFAVDMAEYELELEEAALDRTEAGSESMDAAPATADFEIRSPINGRVLRVVQESSAVVAAGAPLIEVGDPGDLEVVVDTLSRDAVRIRPGAAVRLKNWGGDEPLQGRVRRVEPSGFTKLSALGVEEQRVNVLVDFDQPGRQGTALGDGFRVDAEIVVWSREDCLQVPTSALFRHRDHWAVFVVDGGIAKRRAVQIGQQNGRMAEVRGGLEEGELVIEHPSDTLEPGTPVSGRPKKGDGGSFDCRG